MFSVVRIGLYSGSMICRKMWNLLVLLMWVVLNSLFGSFWMNWCIRNMVCVFVSVGRISF